MAFSKNPEYNIAIIWLLMSIGSLILLFPLISLTITNDSVPGRYFPLALLITMAFIGFMAAISYFWSGRKLKALMSGKNLLIHWSYKPEEIAPYLNEERKRIKKVKSVLLSLSIIFFIIAALTCFDKNGIDYLAVGENIFFLLMIAAFIYLIVPAMGYGKEDGTDFYLGKNGALFGGRFYNWSMMGAGLRKIEYIDGVLRISFSSTDAYGGKNILNLRMPVPPGREGELKEAIKPLLQAMDVYKTAKGYKRL